MEEKILNLHFYQGKSNYLVEQYCVKLTFNRL